MTNPTVLAASGGILDGRSVRGPEDDTESRIGTHIGGRYRLKSHLGDGGMGSVYVAEDLDQGVDVAIKLLHPRLAVEDHHLARFRRETEVASQLSHPNVVRVFHHGQEPEGAPWMAMELIRGESLSSMLKREGTLPPERSIRLVRQIAFAIASVHEVGVVHRDLKPGNVMLAKADRVVVVDFGLARFFASDTFQKLTITGQVVGTPTYMAPEQAFGDVVDARADVYSIGAILYSLLVGQPPFGSGRIEEVLPRLLSDDRVPLTETHPEFGPLAQVVERCLAADPDARYATATALEVALRQLDPSPSRTLAEWTRPPSIDTLVLEPDPILDAPRTRGATMATLRQGRGQRPSVAPPVAAEKSASVAAPSPAEFPIWLALLFLVVTGAVAGTVVLLASDDDRQSPAVAIADGSSAAPVRPVAMDPVDVGPADANVETGADAGESLDAAESTSEEHESTRRRREAAPPEVSAERGPSDHAEAVRVRFVVASSDQPFERVRAALLAGRDALATCYAGVDQRIPTTTAAGTVRLMGVGNVVNTSEGPTVLHRCVRNAFLMPFGRNLGAPGAFDVQLRYFARASAAYGVEVADLADIPSQAPIEVLARVLYPGPFSRGELTDEIGDRVDDVHTCLDSVAAVPTQRHVSTVTLSFDGGVAPRGVSINGSTYNLPRDVYDCVYGPLTEAIRLPARPPSTDGPLRFRITLTPEAAP